MTSRQARNENTGTTQVSHILTPEAADLLAILKNRMTAANRGFTVSTSEVIRRCIAYTEMHTRPTK